MSQPTENLRVRRTRKLLRDALMELIEERGFDRLTVGEITGRAMVSRAAFYRSHRDKYQLVELVFDEAVAEMLGSFGAADRTPLERWVGFFEHVDAYHRFYGALLGRNGSAWFADRMRATLAGTVAAHLPPPPGGRTGPDLVPAVLAAMSVQSITWWLDNGRPVPPRGIAVRSARLAAVVIAEAQSWRAPGSAPNQDRDKKVQS